MLEPAPGLVIADKYRLERQMGAGGMGSVWLAEHLTLGSPVAVKLLHAEIADATVLNRFTAEAKAAAALRSPHVVQILDHGIDGDTPFIVMERLEGESLGDRLLRNPAPDFDETLTILTHTARAIARAHEAGIVHRDLKPDNIFLHANDDEFVAKVLDFGIAKVQPEFLTELSPQTNTGMLIGSPYYMSPEQAEGRRDLDWRSDLWALGIIVYECMTGALPYNEETLGKMLVKLIKEEPLPPSSVTAVPQGFDAWFAKANHKDRFLRFQSAKEMLDAFRDLRDQPLVKGAGTESFAPTLPGNTPAQYVKPNTAPGVTSSTNVSLTSPEGSNRPRILGLALAIAATLSLAVWLSLPAREKYTPEGAPIAHSAEASHSEKAPTPSPRLQQKPQLESPAVVRPHSEAPDPEPPLQKAEPSLPPSPTVKNPATRSRPATIKPAATPPSPKPEPKPAVAPPPPAPDASPVPFNPLDLRY